MTQQAEATVDTDNPVAAKTPKEKPVIECEEDMPFPDTDILPRDKEQDINTTIKVANTRHKHEIDSFKHKLAKNLIYICLGSVGVFAFTDAFFHIESELFRSAFDTLKLITMTALGFIFGVNIQND